MVRRTKQAAEETRSLILDAAEQVFRDKGVTRTSLTDIASQAGVTRGAIYWHFANKAELFTAMCDRATLPLEALFGGVAGPDLDDPLAAKHLTNIAAALRACPSVETVDRARG